MSTYVNDMFARVFEHMPLPDEPDFDLVYESYKDEIEGAIKNRTTFTFRGKQINTAMELAARLTDDDVLALASVRLIDNTKPLTQADRNALLLADAALQRAINEMVTSFADDAIDHGAGYER